MKLDKAKRRVIIESGIVFLLVGIFFLCVTYISDIAPLGSKSFFVYDAEDQYFDFFIFFRRVLEGKANFDFSFSKSLGGSLYALFAYYLSSPLNYILLFFDTEKIYIGFYVVTLLKLCLCGVTFNIFLYYRFKELKNYYRLALAFAYSFMQYNITQMQNIMWLDGVIILPLMLLGVHFFVKNKKKILFWIAIILSIVSNWYTAYMNCIFVVLFYIVEEINFAKWKDIKYEIKKSAEFLLAELIGVFASMAFFAPAILGLLQGKGIESTNIFKIDTSTSLLNMFTGYTMGNKLTVDLSFYCGIIFIILVVAFLTKKTIAKKIRISYALLLLFLIFSCWFLPIQNIWNGFRFAYSYFYRFSYIICLLILIMAAYFLESEADFFYSKKYVLYLLGYLLSVIILYRYGQLESVNAFIFTALFTVIWLLFLLGTKKLKRYNKYFLVLFLTIIELSVNTVLLCKNIYTKNFDYMEFVADQEKVVSYIQGLEDGTSFYRMEQTDPYTRWCFSEALAYGYNGVAHYSSAYDEKTGKFLRKLGYTDYGKASIYREPILGADSFLGTKYIWSKRDQEEFECINKIEDYLIYRNEYSMPLGFLVNDIDLEIDDYNNPFLFQNALYSKLVGKDVQLYKKIEVNIEQKDGALLISNSELANGILYGYVRTGDSDLELYVNGEYQYPYSVFMSSLVFSCGDAQNTNIIELVGAKNMPREAEFYFLDTDYLREIIAEIKENSFSLDEVKDGYVKGNIYSENEEKLLFTIPNVDGWTATVNGKKISIEDAYETFISIDLKPGYNEVELQYELPGKRIGGLLSIGAIIVMVLWLLYDKSRLKNK